jgi:hypothetical protein
VTRNGGTRLLAAAWLALAIGVVVVAWRRTPEPDPVPRIPGAESPPERAAPPDATGGVTKDQSWRIPPRPDPGPPPRIAATKTRPAHPHFGADPARAPLLKHVKDSAHYRVSCDISPEASDEAAALLERAWPIWVRRFGLDEAYDPGPGRFSVRLYATERDLDAGLRKDLGYPVNCLGFVDFVNYRMFALRHSDPYERRRILLHEGMHQFLYRLVGYDTAQSLARWYDEGCAHESEKHVLDGERLELFQDRGGVYSNQIATARNAFASGGINLRWAFRNPERLDDGVRAYGWALVHCLRTSSHPDDAAWFRDYEAAALAGDRSLCNDVVDRLGHTGGNEMRKRLIAQLDEIASKPESR